MQIIRHLLALKKRHYLQILLVWMSVVLYLSLASFRIRMLSDVPNTDKWVHMAMYGIMAFLAFMFFNVNAKSNTLRLTFAFLLPFLYGMIIEYIQGMPGINRKPDIWDLAANTLGIIVGLTFSVVLFKKALQKKFK